jgi:hypothetical protein
MQLFFLTLAVIPNAQPLPPTTPSGSPVPISALFPFLIGIIGFGIYLFKKNRE